MPQAHHHSHLPSKAPTPPALPRLAPLYRQAILTILLPSSLGARAFTFPVFSNLANSGLSSASPSPRCQPRALRGCAGGLERVDQRPPHPRHFTAHPSAVRHSRYRTSRIRSGNVDTRAARQDECGVDVIERALPDGLNEREQRRREGRSTWRKLDESTECIGHSPGH